VVNIGMKINGVFPVSTDVVSAVVWLQRIADQRQRRRQD